MVCIDGKTEEETHDLDFSQLGSFEAEFRYLNSRWASAGSAGRGMHGYVALYACVCVVFSLSLSRTLSFSNSLELSNSLSRTLSLYIYASL
jgi:hypothetical protein